MTQLEALLRLGREMERAPEAGLLAAEALLRVRDRQGRLRPLRANVAQRAFALRSGRENIVLKARQMGMSTWVAGRFFLRTITRPGTLTLHVAHTREAAESLFTIVRRMWEELPEGMRAGPLRLQRANAGQMVFAEMGSEVRVASASDANAGRGLSLQQLHCSEVSRWPGDAGATLAGLRAALAPDGELTLESTPQGAYGGFYEAWRSGVEAWREEPEGDAAREKRMVRHFFPWWMEPAYVGPVVAPAAMTMEEIGLVQRHGLSGAQIGFRRGLEARYGVLRAQEFAEDAETCFRATGACCFELEALERRLLCAPEAASQRRNGALQIWLPPMPGRQYVLGVDSAGGGAEGDFSVVQVVELAPGFPWGGGRGRLGPGALGGGGAELGREYGQGLMAVERNNHGAAVLALLETEHGYRPLYRQGGQPGWLTTAASKPEIVAGMGVLLAETPERFMSRRLLAECRSFVSDAQGRAGAAPGAHDDLVMGMAIAQAVRAEVLQRGWGRSGTAVPA